MFQAVAESAWRSPPHQDESVHVVPGNAGEDRHLRLLEEDGAVEELRGLDREVLSGGGRAEGRSGMRMNKNFLFIQIK